MTNALDKLVAERVMGWAVSTNPMCKKPAVFQDSDGSIWYANGLALYSPSRDANAAFMAVDKLRAEGWRLTLEDSVDGYDAMFIERDTEEVLTGRIFYGTHDDRLTAILLAALAVKGVSDEEVQAASKEGA